MEPQTLTESAPQYRVLIDSMAAEGRVFHRGDLLTAEDAPGEIESMLHAGVIERVGEAIPDPGAKAV
jgi:hypothetical protein